MIKKTGWFLFVLFVFVFLAFTGTVPAQTKPVELTFSHFMPATHGHAILSQEWGKEVEKRTNGAVKVNLFPGATLTPAHQAYDGVVKGISDLAFVVLSYTSGRFPLTEVIDMPLGYKSGLQATRLVNAFFQKFHPKEFDDTQVMYLHAHGPGILHTKKPVARLEDLKGLKIRCTGTSAKVVSHLGGTPVAIPMPEAYDSLQKGVTDGIMAPIEALKGWKFAEVIKSTTLNYNSAYSIAFAVIMNKQKWASLPKDVQATIQKVNEEWIIKSGKAWDDFDKAGMETTKAKGNQILSLSKQEDERWAKMVQPILNDYVQSMKTKGLPGDEALKFCLDWLKKNP